MMPVLLLPVLQVVAIWNPFNRLLPCFECVCTALLSIFKHATLQRQFLQQPLCFILCDVISGPSVGGGIAWPCTTVVLKEHTAKPAAAVRAGTPMLSKPPATTTITAAAAAFRLIW
jgi:hypothetical protein